LQIVDKSHFGSHVGFVSGGHKKDAKKALLLAEGISFAIFHSF
jgi:hypothetical protein